jgi:hypothetical protein
MRATIRACVILGPIVLVAIAAILFGEDLLHSWHRERVRGNLPAVARELEKARLGFRRDFDRDPTLADLLSRGLIGPFTLPVLAAPLGGSRSGPRDLPPFEADVDDPSFLAFGDRRVELVAPSEPLRLGQLVVYPLAPPTSAIEWSLVVLPDEGLDVALVVWTDTSAEWIERGLFAERFADMNRRRRDRGRTPLVDPGNIPDSLAAALAPQDSSP